MNKTASFEDFLATQSVQVPALDFIINLLVAGVLAFIIGRLYVRFGNAISNREIFSRNLLLLTLITMVVITIVKSSLALSLGLVGALSIVRFRAAIKDPEELIYLFFAISIGLGMGADQLVTSLIACTVIGAIIVVRGLRRETHEQPNNLYITVTSNSTNDLSLESISSTLKSHCRSIELKRYDFDAESIEAAFHVDVKKISDLEQLNTQLKELDNNVRVSFIEQNGIFE